MGWKLDNYNCECGNEYEYLRGPEEPVEAECKACGKLNPPGISMPAVAAFSIMDPASRAASLKKRSAEHTKQQLKKEGKYKV
jgi:hypothetical protein